MGIWLAGSVAESVSATVTHRLGLASRAIFEIRAVIEDTRADRLGAIETGIMLFEQSVLPMVLFGLETFHIIPKKTMNQLNSLSNRFLKNLLGVGKYGCPIPMLYLETGMWTMENRILFRKIMFFHHLKTLPEESLAKEVTETQMKLNLPGLATEMAKTLKDWNISNVEMYTKNQFRNFMRKKVSQKNKEDLFSQSKNYKKIDLRNYEGEVKMKDYMRNLNLSSGRMIFRKNSFMIKTVMMNFKAEKRYKSLNYICQECLNLNPPVSHLDHQEALLSNCQGNADLRVDLDLDDNNQLAEYLRRVIDRRTQRMEND